MQNMTEMNGSHPRSKTTEKIIQRFIDEFIRAQSNDGEQVSMADFPNDLNTQSFVEMIKELLKFQDIAPGNIAEAILPQSLLDKRLSQIDTESKLKQYFPSGYVIQPALVPFTYYGHEIEDDNIVDGEYLTHLIRENADDGKTVGGYSQFSSYIHKLFPEEMQNSSFVVGEYDKDGMYEITTEDRERIKQQYTEAFNQLKDSINKAANRTYH